MWHLSVLVLTLAAQDAPSPDKNNYTVLNPTPDTELLELSADRPVNAATGVWRRGLTHRDEGHPLVSLIASNTTTAGVEGRFAIHQKAISVMTMRKLHLHKPATVRLPVHRIRKRIPAIEIAHKTNGLGCWSRTIKVHRLRHIFGAVPVIGGCGKGNVHSEP